MNNNKLTMFDLIKSGYKVRKMEEAEQVALWLAEQAEKNSPENCRFQGSMQAHYDAACMRTEQARVIRDTKVNLYLSQNPDLDYRKEQPERKTFIDCDTVVRVARGNGIEVDKGASNDGEFVSICDYCNDVVALEQPGNKTKCLIIDKFNLSIN